MKSINKRVLFILLIIMHNISAQTKEITIKDSNSKESLSNVLIYTGKYLLAKTDKIGKVYINVDTLKTINIVKEDYEDISISKSQITNIIFLKKLEVIKLNEIVVFNNKSVNILDSIKFNFYKNCNNYKNPNPIQYYNILTINNDTLHYINDRLKFIKNEGYYVNNQNRIIRNYKTSSISQMYYVLKEKKITFWDIFNVRIKSICNNNDYLKIIENQKDYNFLISSDSIFYKINFESKKLKKNSYKGCYIIDKSNFSIKELYISLIFNKSNTYNSFIFNDNINQTYKINSESISYSFIKIGDIYELKSTNYDIEFEQIKGNFKGSLFINKFRAENTFDFKDNNAIKFNFYD